MLVTKERGFQK